MSKPLGKDQEAVAVAKDLAHAQANPAAEFSMDNLVKLLADERECANMIEFWTKQRREVQARIKDAMGESTVGTVQDQPVVFYDYVDRFNVAAFVKDNPNLARVYSRAFTEERVDVEMLRSKRPELFQQYQVRVFRNRYEPPGSGTVS